MTSLNNKVREEIGDLLKQELRMVDAKAKKVADEYWKKAEHAIAIELGYDEILVRIEHLQNQIEGLQTELNQLEGTLLERAQEAGEKHYKECGLEVSVDKYGRISSYSRPNVFGREIRTVWDTKILKNLNEQVSFFKVYENINTLHHSVRRELLLTGTFEEARILYQRFHVKIADAIGEDIPGMISEVQAIPKLKSAEEQGL